MSTDLRLRRHLYDQAAAARGRRRRMFRKQIAVLAVVPPEGPGGGPAGSREPRRPHPSAGPASMTASAERHA